jgi:hypothetical protein
MKNNDEHKCSSQVKVRRLAVDADLGVQRIEVLS